MATWEWRVLSPRVIVSWVQTVCCEGQGMAVRGMPQQPRLEEEPRSNIFRCYVDGALFVQSGGVVFGCVAFDPAGKFYGASNGMLRCHSYPLLAEVMAVREALSWLNARGVVDVDLFSDSQRVVQALKDRSFTSLSYIGSLIEDCRLLVLEFNVVNFLFISRSKNIIAHSLARKAEVSCDVWISSPPDFIFPNLMN
ncbi:hypothetical protein DM860_002167 [Cuscuta australis]|uniref:RNase H type-1 domain-containing protein n=1 Tax=Cuscuta australis TaxID=267555 RepID=A0A328DX66_9ASTE|nr:hypothetical protein DM860_002167 [Cuscuta australis]